MSSESGAVSGPFTAVQLHELKRQIELFQELNKNLRLILENGHSSSKKNNKPNKKIGTKSASKANIAVPEGGTGNVGEKRKSATTESAKESQKENDKRGRAKKSGKAIKKEEFSDIEEEEEDHDEPSLDTAELEDTMTETQSANSSPTLSSSSLTEENASDPDGEKDIKEDVGPMLELCTFRSVVPKWPNPDDAPCSVCGDESSTDVNEMLICEGPGCSTVVHQDCYGISKIPEGEWLCDACEAGLSPKESHCLLCPIAGGALRRIVPKSRKVILPQRKDLYVHVACALWIPDAIISRPKRMQGISLDSLQSNRSEMECQACKQHGGAIL